MHNILRGKSGRENKISMGLLVGIEQRIYNPEGFGKYGYQSELFKLNMEQPGLHY